MRLVLQMGLFPFPNKKAILKQGEKFIRIFYKKCWCFLTKFVTIFEAQLYNRAPYAAVVELADGICLESRRAATLRGFKSLLLRFL